MDRFRLTGNSDDERWFRAGSYDVTTTVLVTATTAFTMLIWVISPKNPFWLTEANWLAPLELWSDRVRHGQLWRIATWPLANAISLFSVLGLALFYLFGREIERHVRRIQFAWILGLLTIVPGVFAAILGFDVAGISLLQFALFGMYVMMYPTARSFFNIPLWVIGAVLLGVQILSLLAYRTWDALLFLALLCGVALLCLRAFNLTDSYPWIPKVPLPAFITKDPYQKANRAREKAQRAQRRSGQNVVNMPTRQPKHLDAGAQADMDRLLDKIAASGINSLTADERRRLDDLSRRLRDQ